MSFREGRAGRSQETCMTSCFASPNYKQTWVPPARLVIASLAAVIAASHHASAASGGNERSVESVQSRNAGEPIMAVVSLRNQRITVYDANGWILRALVSSGQKGRETVGRGAPAAN